MRALIAAGFMTASFKPPSERDASATRLPRSTW
jgi:hypothetical protein